MSGLYNWLITDYKAGTLIQCKRQPLFMMKKLVLCWSKKSYSYLTSPSTYCSTSYSTLWFRLLQYNYSMAGKPDIVQPQTSSLSYLIIPVCFPIIYNLFCSVHSFTTSQKCKSIGLVEAWASGSFHNISCTSHFLSNRWIVRTCALLCSHF